MTDLGRTWDGRPASVRIVSRGELKAARSRGLTDVTPGGVRQYDIVYPPDATPGRPRGHPQSTHSGESSGYAYEYPVGRASLQDRIAQLERRVAALERAEK